VDLLHTPMYLQAADLAIACVLVLQMAQLPADRMIIAC
jgi:hypothetical protein